MKAFRIPGRGASGAMASLVHLRLPICPSCHSCLFSDFPAIPVSVNRVVDIAQQAYGFLQRQSHDVCIGPDQLHDETARQSWIA